MDVLIVGAGPTGLTLGCTLAAQGPWTDTPEGYNFVWGPLRPTRARSLR
ncbi:MAG: FAD-dependent monooxygenase [Pseudonocardia sp.]